MFTSHGLVFHSTWLVVICKILISMDSSIFSQNPGFGSCAEILREFPQAQSTYYWLKIGDRDAQVYCDMGKYGMCTSKCTSQIWYQQYLNTNLPDLQIISRRLTLISLLRAGLKMFFSSVGRLDSNNESFGVWQDLIVAVIMMTWL